MAAAISNVRPAVLHAETRDHLDRYRGFRHIVRNVYTFNLDPTQIEVLVQRLPNTVKEITQDLEAFAHFLETVSRE